MEGYIYWFLFSVRLGYRYLGDAVAPIGVKFCVMVHIGPRQIFFSPFEGGIRGIPKIQNFAH